MTKEPAVYARPNLSADRWDRLKRLCKKLGYARWGGLLDRWMDFTDECPSMFEKERGSSGGYILPPMPESERKKFEDRLYEAIVNPFRKK